MNRIPILLYHDLVSSEYPNEKNGEATKSTVVNASDFDSQMKYLLENGYRTVSIRDYFQWRTEKFDFPKKAIIITFDDGHYSNYRVAFQILKKYRFTATFFLVTEKISQKNHVSVGQVEEMLSQGMEIGSHGKSHNFLPTMGRDQIKRELIDSKQALEEIVQKRINYFAFPGGHYNRLILELLALTGYQGACSCHQGLNSARINPFLLKRIEVRKNTSISKFHNIFNPYEIAMYRFIDFWKNGMRQTVGLRTYEKIRHRLYMFYPFKR